MWHRLRDQAKNVPSAILALCLIVAWPSGRGVSGEPETGAGLKGEYFADIELGALKLTRIDARIDFDWSETPPDKRMPLLNYSVRWTGSLLPRFSEEYTFYTYTDDGVRLWVNGTLLVDNWVDQPPTEKSGKIRLEAGKSCDLKMEYYQIAQNAIAKLSWSSLSQKKEVIPQDRLSPRRTTPARGGQPLSAAIPVLSVPEGLPRLEKHEDWQHALAALEAYWIPQAWLLLGLLEDTEFKLFSRARSLEAAETDDWTFAPRDEAGKPLAVTLWKRPADEEGASGYVDLAQALSREGQALAFARIDVDWPVAGAALLWLAHDGRCVVYLNNTPVFKQEAGKANLELAGIPLSMNKGRNVLKIKSGQHKGPWGFSARLERNDPAYRIALLERLLELYPDSASGVAQPSGLRPNAEDCGSGAWLEIARCHEVLGQAGEARPAYQRALAQYGENDEIRIAVEEGLRRVQGRQKGEPEAANQAWKAVEQAYGTLLEAGQATASDRLLRDFVARYPFHEQAAAALALRGALREDFGLAGDSRQYFQRAVRENRTNGFALNTARQGLAFAQALYAPRRLFDTAPETQATLDGVRRQLCSGDAGDLEKGVRSLSVALRVGGGQVVQVSDAPAYGRHVGVREYARALLLSLSPAAREAYRRAVAPEAEERLRRALQIGDVALLEAVAAQYPGTAAAARALNCAGNLEWDRGAWSEAASYCERLRRECHGLPDLDGAISRAQILAKLAQALWRSGESAAARQARDQLAREHGQEKLSIAGTTVAAGEYARGLLREDGAHGPSPGMPTATPPARQFEPGGLVWARVLRQSPTLESARATLGGGARLPFTTLQLRPLVVEGRAFESTLESLRALDLASGRRLWGLSWESAGTLAARGFTGLPVSCPSAQDGRVYLRVLNGRQSALRCYLAEDGRLCWDSAADPTLGVLTWLSDPVLAYGLAIAVFRERVDEGLNAHGVAALDASTGELRWLRTVASGETGFPLGQERVCPAMQLAPPLVGEGVIYTPTGLGSMAALNAVSGEVVWVSGYPSVRIADAVRGNSALTGNVPQRVRKFIARDAVSPIAAGDLVVLLPREAPSLLAFDRQTGEIRWRHDLLDARFLAGPFEDLLFAGDDTVRAFRAATGASVWEYTVPKGLFAAPLCTGGALCLPGNGELCVVDARTGTRKEALPWDSRTGPLGNLIVAQDRLIGLSQTVIAALGPRGSPAAECAIEDGKAQLRAGKLLESPNGAWKVSPEAMAEARRTQAQEPPVAQAAGNKASGVAPSLHGTLSYAWHFRADEPQIVFPRGGTADRCWVCANKTLYCLRLGGVGSREGGPALAPQPEVLWQNYIGLDKTWLAAGPRALVVGDSTRFVALDRATGELLWSAAQAVLQNKTRGDANLDPFSGGVSDERSVAVFARDGLLCFDLQTGQERWWKKQYTQRIIHCAFAGGKLAVVSGCGGQATVYNAYDVLSGKELLTRQLQHGTDWTWSAASPDNRYAVFRPNPQHVWCVDMATGELEWDASIFNPDVRLSPGKLSWESQVCAYYCANKERPDATWMAYELSVQDGLISRAYGLGSVTLGDSVLYVGDGNWSGLPLQRSDLQRPAQGIVWGQKVVWHQRLPQEMGQGCRFRGAFLSQDSARLYAFFVRESRAYCFLLRTFDWANGQLLDEEILPGTPFPHEEWDKPYRGLAEQHGNLLLYTALDGVYAYTPRGESRHETAARLRAALAEPLPHPPPAAGRGTGGGPVQAAGDNAAQRREGRLALAGVEPVTLHALLAPKDLRVESEPGVWEQAPPLLLAGPEYYVPLACATDRRSQRERLSVLPAGSTDESAPQSRRGHLRGTSWGGVEDLSARVHASWNQDGVFVAVEVQDDRYVPPASASALSSGDSLCVAVNATPDDRWGYDPRENVVCSLALVNGETVLQVEDSESSQQPGRRTVETDPQARASGKVSLAPDGKGLRYVLALPWRLLRHGAASQTGERKEIHLGLAVYDNDGEGTKGALEWGGGITPEGKACQWQNVFPPWLGRLSLLEVSRERIERYRRVLAKIPDTSEALMYLRLILESKRGPQAEQEKAEELAAFLKANPASKNAYRALVFLRSIYKNLGEPDPAAKTMAAAREAGCPKLLLERLAGKQDPDEKGTGLEGEYYDNPDLTKLKLTRVDPEINFEWRDKGPHPSMRQDRFSVRWTGQLRPLYSETYMFYTLSDDGVRLWVDDQLLVDNWTAHSATEDSGKIALAAGEKHDIRLEYFQGWSLAVMRLAWSSPSQKKEIIPQSCLFPPAFQGANGAKSAPPDQALLQAGYREAARLLPDASDGWMLLQLVLSAYPADALAQRIQECEAYLREFPETVNAAPMLRTLRQLYAQAGRNAAQECEDLIQACKLPREARWAYYAQYAPAWTEWHVLGPVHATGEDRGMEQALEPERGVDLGWKAVGPLEIPLAWQRIGRLKNDPDETGVVDLYGRLLGGLEAQKKAEIEREPYFAYAYRKVSVPTPRRATLFFGANDTLTIWLNGKRIAPPSLPGLNKDSQAAAVGLREGENEVLLKVGIPSGRLHFFFRIADANGRPFEDLPKE